MKTKQKEHSVVIGAQETVVQTISSSKIAAATAILRDKLYTDKLKAAITEPLCNAIDEHRKHGIKRPVDVYLLHDEIVIRDYANGLSDEVAYKVFFQYLETTKDDTETQIGGFGLGAKAPGAYSNNYTVESYYKGRKTTFWSRVDGDLNLVSKVDSRETDKPSGIAVHIPLAGDTEKQVFDSFCAACKLLFDLHTIIGSSPEAEFRVLSAPTCDACSAKFISETRHSGWGYDSAYGNIEESHFEEFITEWSDVEDGTADRAGIKLIEISSAFSWVASRMLFHDSTTDACFSKVAAQDIYKKYEPLVKYLWDPSTSQLVSVGAKVTNRTQHYSYYNNTATPASEVQQIDYIMMYTDSTGSYSRHHMTSHTLEHVYSYKFFQSDFFSHTRAPRLYDGDLIYALETTPSTDAYIKKIANNHLLRYIAIVKIPKEDIIVNQNRETASFTVEAGERLWNTLQKDAETLCEDISTFYDSVYDSVIADEKMQYAHKYTLAVKESVCRILKNRSSFFKDFISAVLGANSNVLKISNAVAYVLRTDGDILISIPNTKNPLSIWLERTRSEGYRQANATGNEAFPLKDTEFVICDDVALLNKLARSKSLEFAVEFFPDYVPGHGRAIFGTEKDIKAILKDNNLFTDLFPNKTNLPICKTVDMKVLKDYEAAIPVRTRKKAHTQTVECLIDRNGNVIPSSEYAATMIYSINEAREASFGTMLSRLYASRDTGFYGTYSIEGMLLPLIGIKHLAVVPKKDFARFKAQGCILASELDITEKVRAILENKVVLPDTVLGVGKLRVMSEDIQEAIMPAGVEIISNSTWTTFRTLLYFGGGNGDNSLVKAFEKRIESLRDLNSTLVDAVIAFKVGLAPDMLLASLGKDSLAHAACLDLGARRTEKHCTEIYSKVESFCDKRLEKLRKDVLKLLRKHRIKKLSPLQ